MTLVNETGSRIGLSHLGIHVRELQESLYFYRDLLGLVEVQQRTKTDDYTRRLVGYPRATLHMAVLKFPSSPGFLEIIEYHGVERHPVDTRTANPGTAHLCLHVEDLDETYARLHAAGVESVSPPQTVTNGPLAGAKVVYLIDPDGIRVELLEASLNMIGEPRE